jgi:hypothetical protein
MASNRSRTSAVSVAVACAVALAMVTPAAAQTVPTGSQFVVTGTGYHLGPRVAMDDDGRFLVAWVWYFGGMGARGFDDNGPVAATFDPDPDASIAWTSDRPVDVTTVGDDDFLVLWEAFMDSAEHIRARRFASDGTAHAGWFVVSDSSDSCTPTAEHLPWGGLVAAWTEGFPGTTSSVMARFFADDGTPLTSAFQVNTTDAGRQAYPVIDAAEDGSFVVVWQSDSSAGDDSSGTSIQGQRFAANGTPTGIEFQVNTVTTGTQWRPVVATAPDGRFVVAWSSASSAGDDADGMSIQARRFKPDGDPDGAEMQINQITSGTQHNAAVTIGASGDYFVTWSCPSADTSATIQGRAMHWSGAAVEDQLTVNETPDPYGSILPAVVGPPDDPGRDFVVAWGDYSFIRGRRLTRSALIFANGFEDGSTSAWSSSVP